MTRLFSILAPLAVFQMVAPMPGGAMVMLVPVCGEGGGRTVPLNIPMKNDGPGGAPCCKICHIAMRKRLGGDSCCGEEDDSDAA
ncbi:hypothetical protein [Novosphingobium cyanobacteriorum]|uniref:Secreted protein n=1 Tax=Novosphingobium cyanobacteriorum TaxID=3024215 RepID=A0ABT6CCB5_9SPHN|nr:hypothetical protein [Novosphingobium cyanobacteriorum]MDF8331584.1 hypothetical protein [Novosphingobium cyanobacteriorum]